MRTAKAQDSDNILTKTTEVRMKHYDKEMGEYNERIVHQQNLIAKEASFVQACGYIPREDGLSAHEWKQMVRRNKMSRGIYEGEQRHPRAV